MTTLSLFVCHISYLLTSWCRVLLEKLTGLQLVKKFHTFLCNPKVHYRTHKRPPPVPILCQPNSVHIPTSHLLEIHPNINHPSKPRSPQWALSLRFPHQDPIHPLSSPIRATCPAHLILSVILLAFCVGLLQRSQREVNHVLTRRKGLSPVPVMYCSNYIVTWTTKMFLKVSNPESDMRLSESYFILYNKIKS